ncbi:MAG: hypothetical protein MUP98_10390 [Candidatus Aminicenantes bacterium]|nr:hypothetical protein [Candidatus Aminicenantes bacterium]
MSYEMKCPLCGQEMSVDSESEAEALELILGEGIKHVKEAHKDLPMDEDMLKQLIQTNMKKT